MNEWVRRSISIANSPGYLDKLQSVYPVTLELERQISPEQVSELKRIYEGGDDGQLIRRLIKFDKFPTKDPYVAYLRKKKEIFVNGNPETVRRIIERIRAMGFDVMLKSITEPKEFNRQIGMLFKRWVPTIGFPMVTEREIVELDGIAFLQGSDAHLRAFANDTLGCNLDKNPDFVAKASGQFVIGEAKFLTDIGGHQNAQFEDALRLLRGEDGRAIRIAVLDGVVWIMGKHKMHKTVCQLEKPAMTALLLKEFLQSI